MAQKIWNGTNHCILGPVKGQGIIFFVWVFERSQGTLEVLLSLIESLGHSLNSLRSLFT